MAVAIKELTDKRGRLKVVNETLAQAFAEAKGAEGEPMVLANIKSMEDPYAEISRLQTEQQELGNEIAKLDAILKAAQETEETAEELRALAEAGRPNLGGGEPDKPQRTPALRSLGHEFMASKERQEWVKRGMKGTSAVHTSNISMRQMMNALWAISSQDAPSALRALFDNSNFDPFDAHDMTISPMPYVGPRMFLSMIPQIPVMSDNVQYHEMTTRTEPSNYTISEGAVYNDFTYVYTKRSVSVIKRGGYVGISGEAEEDGPQIVDDINRDMVMGIARSIDGYCVDQVEANTSTNQISAGGQSATSALWDGISAVYTNGGVDANLIVMNTADWDEIVKEQSAAGDYLFSGNADRRMMMMRWGVPVVLDNAVNSGSALVLDTDAVRFRDRRALDMYVTQRFQTVTEDSQNRTAPIDQMLHVGDARFAFYVRVPKRISEVTGL